MSGLTHRLLLTFSMRDDDPGLLGQRNQAPDPLGRRIGGVVVRLDVVGVGRVVAVDHLGEMAVRRIELDLELPGARHPQRRPLRGSSAAPGAAADAAGHEQDRVGAECLRRAERGLALGERPGDLALVRAVELGPAVEDGVDAHPELLGHLPALRSLRRRNDAALHALEPGVLHPLQIVFGGAGDESLSLPGLECQRRHRRRRCLGATLRIRGGLRLARGRTQTGAGRKGRGRRHEFATVD